MKRIIFLLIFCSVMFSMFAQNSRIKELERQREQILSDIANTSSLLRDTRKDANTLLHRISLISSQISSRQQVVTILNRELESISVDERQMESDIVVLEGQLKDQLTAYSKAIDGMLRNRQSENRLLFILSGKSLSESYRRVRYLREYSEWRSAQADEIKNKQDQLKEKRTALTKTKEEKIVLLKTREHESENLKKEETNYKGEVAEAQKKQKNLQQILTQKRRQADSLNKQIERLIAEEVARQEEKARRLAQEQAAKEQKGKSSGTSKHTTEKAKVKKENDAPPIISTQENIRLSGDFASNKGQLPFPITGNAIITTRFGTHQHAQWKVSTTSNGIDIQSQSGAEARAVFAGEVSRVIAFPGYNNCVIMRHGSYYTFYGNIQTLYVKQGDRISTGQKLGKVYLSNETGTTQMHFQLWRNTTKMNPEPWLKR